MGSQVRYLGADIVNHDMDRADFSLYLVNQLSNFCRVGAIGVQRRGRAAGSPDLCAELLEEFLRPKNSNVSITQALLQSAAEENARGEKHCMARAFAAGMHRCVNPFCEQSEKIDRKNRGHLGSVRCACPRLHPIRTCPPADDCHVESFETKKKGRSCDKGDHKWHITLAVGCSGNLDRRIVWFFF